MALKQCTMCDRTFTKLEHLKRHERSHTKERPYECPTCNKCFSRSDVLFRHCKGHAQVALNRSNNSEDRMQQNNTSSMSDLHDLHDSHQTASRVETNEEPTSTSQIREPPESSPEPRRQSSYVPQHDRSHQMDALINAAQHLEPSWQSSAPTLLTRPDDYQLAESHHMGLGPPIDPVINSLPYAPAGTVSNLDQWTFDLVHNNNPALNRTPTDSLQSWLFPPGSPMQTPDNSHHMELEGVFNRDTLPNPPNVQASPSGSSASMVSRIPCERFARVASCWPSRVWRPSRLMPSLWQNLTSCMCTNILSDVPSDTHEHGADRPGRQTSRWHIDERHRVALQDTLMINLQHDTAGLSTHEHTMAMGYQGNPRSSVDRAQFPPAEILDIALEMYLNYFHPTLPIIHVPTFSVRNTSQPLLLSMCLIGLSILGTTGAVKFVTQTFPTVLHLVMTELRSLSSSHHPPHRQIRIIATSLLALNLASITGRRNRIAQAEQLYVELLTISQNQGLFTIDESDNIDTLLRSQPSNEQKWATWINSECVKRIIYGLIEADCWWAGYLSMSPIIRPEAVRVFPTADQDLYQAKSYTAWQSLINLGAKVHKHAITPFLDPTLDLRPGASGCMWNLLTLVLLRMYEYNDRLATATSDSKQLEPWRIYDEDQRSRDIVSLVVGLSSTMDVSHTVELNSVVLWHASCMKMGANMQCFELAAGRCGAEPATTALEDISSWSQTPSARRSILHAAQIFKLLSDRKVSDIVHPHSVVALFHAALVLGLYIFTLPSDNDYASEHCIELVDPVDWKSVGRLGLSDGTPTPSVGPEGNMASRFIQFGGDFSISGVILEGGYLPARKTLLHCADLMEGMGRWKSTTFSQILHIMSDDLTDDDNLDHSSSN